MATPSHSSSEETAFPLTSRRHGRQLTLQMLFQHEFQPSDEGWQEKFWAKQSMTSEVKTFALRLFHGVQDHQSDIDAMIGKFAVGWVLDRMPVVDRNILRVSIYELFWEAEIPAMVSINEAVELAKRFADDETKRFVNGLLDHILRVDVRLSGKRIKADLPPVSPDDSFSQSRS